MVTRIHFDEQGTKVGSANFAEPMLQLDPGKAVLAYPDRASVAIRQALMFELKVIGRSYQSTVWPADSAQSLSLCDDHASAGTAPRSIAGIIAYL
jgi:hypothetical protein